MLRRIIYTLLLSGFLFAPSGGNASLTRWLGLDTAGQESARDVANAIDRAIRSLRFLQEEFDADIEGYLSEIDRISAERLEEVLGGENIPSIIDDTIKQIDSVRAQAFYDARELIWEVECLIPVFSDQLERTLGNALTIISESEAEVRVPILGGLEATAELSVQPVNIASPDQAYEQFKSVYLNAIKDVGEDGSAISIMAAYGNISRMARITSCHYRNLSLSRYFLAEVAYYESLSAHWAVLTGLDEI